MAVALFNRTIEINGTIEGGGTINRTIERSGTIQPTLYENFTGNIQGGGIIRPVLEEDPHCTQ